MTMELRLINCLLLAAVLALMTSCSCGDRLSYVHRMAVNPYNDDQHEVINNVAKSGKMENCGEVDFNITWSPDPVSPSQVLKVHVEFIVPHDMNGGTYNITISFHKDTEPFLEFADNFDCDKISKYIPCPLRKGWKINKTQMFEHIPNIGSYPGDYDLRMEIKNSKDQQMICLKAHVPISKN